MKPSAPKLSVVQADLDLIARSRANSHRARSDAMAAVEAELSLLESAAGRLRDAATLPALPAGLADRVRRLSLDIWSGVNTSTLLMDRAKGTTR